MKKILTIVFTMGFAVAPHAHANWTTINVKSCGKGIAPAIKCNGPMLRTTGYLLPNSSGHIYQTNADIGSAWTCRASATGDLPIFFENDSVKSVSFSLLDGGITVLQYSAVEKNFAQDWIIVMPGANRTCEEAKKSKGVKG